MKLSFLPFSDFPRNDMKQWMGFRHYDAVKQTIESWCALFQLFLQVNPFEEQLPIGFFNLIYSFRL